MGHRWAVVLAAGEGKRMCSQKPKVLHTLCGRPMIGYILQSAASAAQDVIVVVGRGAAQVREAMGPGWRYVQQEKQLGTGDALNTALPLLPDLGELMVLCGDTPLLDEAQLQALLIAHDGSAATVLTTILPDPAGYGRIIKDIDGRVRSIVEERDVSAEEKLVPEVNTGAYCFDLKLLKRYLPLVSNKNAQGEFYLTDVIALLSEDGYRVGACRVPDYRIGLGINDRAQLAEATAIMRERINGRLMRQGVTMIDPAAVYIDYGVAVGADTVIFPQTVIEGDSKIGGGCVIGPGAHLINARLGDLVTVRQSVVEDTALAAGTKVAPYSYIKAGKDSI